MTPASRGLRLVERPQEVEASLWRRFRLERQAQCRELLFDRHLPLARAIARREFRRRPAYGLERADFDQLAVSGLLEAIDRFDPMLGARFEAFAKHRIRGAIADGVARSSESGAQYNFRQRLESERLRSLQAGNPTTDYVIELADLAAALAIGLIAESAHRSGPQRSNPLPGYEGERWREMREGVVEEIERLPEAEKSIMQQHYFNGVPFVEIARLLGLSKGRVSQLHRAALMRVRERLRRFE